MKSSILITGAGGTLGRLVLEKLSAIDIEIYAISSNAGKLENKYKKKHIHFYTPEQFYADEIDFRKIDTILHLAFARSQQGFELAKSIEFTSDILKKACEQKVPTVYNISSQSVYGNKREQPSTEDDSVNPFDLYSLAKYACECLASEICENSSTKITHIRLASLLSPFLEDRIINKMLKSVLESNELTIIGGSQVFSYLDTRDAVDALICVILKKHDNLAPVYNLGSNEFYGIKEIANIIQSVIKNEIKKDARISYVNKEINTLIKLNSDKFYHDFSWKPKYSLKDTITWILNT